MAFTVIRPTLHLLVLVLTLLENLYDEGVGGTGFTDEELDQQLKILNKPFVKSFKMGDGDIYDCVNIYRQPAFSHPLLKGHKIQREPSSVPVMDAGKSAYEVKDEDFGTQNQTCPSGTVPIRRTSKQDLIKAQILKKALRERTRTSNLADHYEWVFSRDKGTYYGVYAQINVQNPKLEDQGQFSEAVMRIESGRGDQLNIIQTGWMVYQGLYHDNRTRLVTSWTADGGKNTGCYNIMCPGFVQVHRRLALGQSFPKISTYGGEQWECKFLIFLDRYSGNWWLVLGTTHERIGYWPKAIFTGMQASGDSVGWGGQVYAPPQKPNPPMGSGHFAIEGFRKAAFIYKLQYLDVQFSRIHPSWDQLVRYTMSPECYTLSQFGSNGIFYGGPGGNCS